jgi:hypothetical protein
VGEIADLFGIHKNTVRRWVKNGLTAIDNKRPMLILGQDLVAFLQARRAKRKQKCRPGELYCVRCRVPRKPAENMVDYSSFTEKIGNLIAICPACGAIMNRRISLAKIREISSKIDITFPKESQRLVERIKPTVNSDLK